MKKYNDNPVDQSKEFKDSGMVLITDPKADAILRKAQEASIPQASYRQENPSTINQLAAGKTMKIYSSQP